MTSKFLKPQNLSQSLSSGGLLTAWAIKKNPKILCMAVSRTHH